MRRFALRCLLILGVVMPIVCALDGYYLMAGILGLLFLVAVVLYFIFDRMNLIVHEVEHAEEDAEQSEQVSMASQRLPTGTGPEITRHEPQVVPDSHIEHFDREETILPPPPRPDLRLVHSDGRPLKPEDIRSPRKSKKPTLH